MPEAPSLCIIESGISDSIVVLLCPRSPLMLHLAYLPVSAQPVSNRIQNAFYAPVAPVLKAKHEPRIRILAIRVSMVMYSQLKWSKDTDVCICMFQL